ncbi:NADH-quinone oxidoreductase subunit C [bacterium]|nr:NADH-quinone oxidoreductase subunit C [bacterium]MCI0602455.1 NADH-quinone oxidoreductase subunit C [bacterium]
MEQGELVQSVRSKIAKHIAGYHSYAGDETILVRRDGLLEVMRTLKDEFKFEMLMDVTVVDFLGQQPRFEVVYHLNSLTHNARLRVKVPLQEGEQVDSVAPLWQIANWLEREAWDMFGVKFINHPDLRRLLMYDEFVGHPLKKDYPINKRQPIVKPKREYR